MRNTRLLRAGSELTPADVTLPDPTEDNLFEVLYVLLQGIVFRKYKNGNMKQRLGMHRCAVVATQGPITFCSMAVYLVG